MNILGFYGPSSFGVYIYYLSKGFTLTSDMTDIISITYVYDTFRNGPIL